MHFRQNLLVLATVLLRQIHMEKFCLKLQIAALMKDEYIESYGGHTFEVVAVTKSYVLLWMSAVAKSRGKVYPLPQVARISSMVCRCLLSVIYQNLSIEDANVDGILCNENREIDNFSISLENQYLQRGRNIPSGDWDPKIWFWLIHALHKLYSHKPEVMLGIKCVKTSSKTFNPNLTNHTWRFAVYDVKNIVQCSESTTNQDMVYALISSNKFDEQTEDLSKCGYSEKYVAHVAPSHYQQESNMNKLFEEFGAQEKRIKGQGVAASDQPCFYLKDKAYHFLAALRDKAVSSETSFELVAENKDQIFLLLPTNNKDQRLAKNLIVETMHRIHVEGRTVTQLICERVLKDKLNQISFHERTNAASGSVNQAPNLAQQVEQDRKPNWCSRCFLATPRNTYVCQKLLPNKKLGIFTISVSSEQEDQWIICIQRNEQILGDPFCGKFAEINLAQLKPMSQNAVKALFTSRPKYKDIALASPLNANLEHKSGSSAQSVNNHGLCITMNDTPEQNHTPNKPKMDENVEKSKKQRLRLFGVELE